MVSSQRIVVVAVLIAALVSVDAENFFSRRRNQNSQQPFQRFNTNSYFRQRLGTQVNWLHQKVDCVIDFKKYILISYFCKNKGKQCQQLSFGKSASATPEHRDKP
jgi:hypothetical protein